MDNNQSIISIKMEGEKYNKDGTEKVEIIKNIYSVPEGFIKEEIVIKRTLIRSKSLRDKEDQEVQLQLE